MNKLHPGARWIFRLRSYVTLFFILLFLEILVVNALSAQGISVKGTIPIDLVLLIAIGEIYARLTYKFWNYEFTKTELKIEKGIIWKKYKSIPFKRIQNVEIHRGIMARIFGFSSLAIQTAGYSVTRSGFGGGAEGNLPGVSIVDGEKIRKFIITKIGKGSGL